MEFLFFRRFQTVRIVLVVLLAFILVSVTNVAAGTSHVPLSKNLPASYTYAGSLELGLYYNLGSFHKLKNAFSLQKKWRSVKSNFGMSVVKYKSFYRAVVGPITKINKNKIREIIKILRVKDVFNVRIDSSDKSIIKMSTSISTSDLTKSANEAAGKQALIEPSVKQKTITNERPNEANLVKGTQTKVVALKSNITINKVNVVRSNKTNSKQSNLGRTRAVNLYKIGDSFSDCELCPEQVVIPSGDFIMGKLSKGDTGSNVTIARVFAISKFEITFNLWRACVNNGGCGGYQPSDEGWGRGRQPVINVSWRDAVGYVNWLSKWTKRRYRLPTEIEWEYAARAGSRTDYWWGDKLEVNRAVCFDCGNALDGKKTALVGSFKKNQFGLFDTAGNVWEWTANCFNKNLYQTAAKNLKSVSVNKIPAIADECSRVLRGGGWDTIGPGIKASFRFASAPSNRSNVFGFRVVREID
jgi:formylglycine-generating enzyme required for sulfatase activity